jgi:hypothetical protein
MSRPARTSKILRKKGGISRDLTPELSRTAKGIRLDCGDGLSPTGACLHGCYYRRDRPCKGGLRATIRQCAAATIKQFVARVSATRAPGKKSARVFRGSRVRPAALPGLLAASAASGVAPIPWSTLNRRLWFSWAVDTSGSIRLSGISWLLLYRRRIANRLPHYIRTSPLGMPVVEQGNSDLFSDNTWRYQNAMRKPDHHARCRNGIELCDERDARLIVRRNRPSKRDAIHHDPSRSFPRENHVRLTPERSRNWSTVYRGDRRTTCQER